MKTKKYSEIKSSNRTNFIMLYNNVCHALDKIEHLGRSDDGKRIIPKQVWYIIRLKRKLEQICANYKNIQNEIETEKFINRADF